MALEVKETINEQSGCREIRFWETTGDYDASTNPTGYGDASTEMAEDITKLVLYLYLNQAEIPYTITFIVDNLTITSAIIKHPDDTEETLSLDNDTFPFTEDLYFSITGEILGFGTDSEIPYGSLTLEYEVYIDDDVVGNSSSDYLITCQVDRQVANALADLTIEDDKCCGPNSAVPNAYRAQAFLDSAKYSNENGEPIKAYDTLKYAFQLASGDCKTC